MLSCSDVEVRYGRGRNLVVPLRGVTAAFRPQRATAIIGPSGSGKSTFLRILAGSQSPSRGLVELDGKKVGAARATVHPRMSVIHQDLRLVGFLTVAENIRLASDLRSIDTTEPEITASLGAVGLRGFEDRMPTTLSGGEQQRVAIARALHLKTRVLLADEPTGSLDEENSLAIAALLADLALNQQVIVVVATHDMGVARRLHRTVRLTAGEFVDVS